MDKKTREEIKKKLILAKEAIINSGVIKSHDQYHVSKDDLADDADLATNVINQDISFRIREQEITKLELINEALEKIETDDFGLCEDCGDSIGLKRLSKQPWAKYCILHAEEREREKVLGFRRAA